MGGEEVQSGEGAEGARCPAGKVKFVHRAARVLSVVELTCRLAPPFLGVDDNFADSAQQSIV